MEQYNEENLTQTKIAIKGIREGLLITLIGGEWLEIQRELLAYLDQQPDFYRGARLAIDVGDQVLKVVELGQLRNEVSERDISLWAVLSNSTVTEQTAQMLGLATRINKPHRKLMAAKPETNLHEGEPAILLHRTLRSGFSLEHNGHVIIIGDLNPGAQIIAGGNVIIWGRLRGMVHAGAEGNEDAIVCALDLSPTQLRIADKIAITPQRRGKPVPEMAHLSDGQVVAEPWKPKRNNT